MEAAVTKEKITIELLTQRFGPPQNVNPFGQVLIIQGEDFNPDWLAQLGDQGHKCHDLTIARKPVTVVELKKLSGGKSVYVPQKPSTILQQEKIIGPNESPIKLPPPEQKAETKPEEKQDFNTNTEGQKRWSPEEDKVLFFLLHGVKYGRNRILKKAMKEGKLPGRTIDGAMQHFDKALRNKTPSDFEDPPPAPPAPAPPVDQIIFAVEFKCGCQEILTRTTTQAKPEINGHHLCPKHGGTTATGVKVVDDTLSAEQLRTLFGKPLQERMTQLENDVAGILVTLHELAEKFNNGEVALCKEVNDLQQRTEKVQKNLHDHKHLQANGDAILACPL